MTGGRNHDPRDHDPRPVAVEGLRALADRFDHVLLDQFGVLHDGRQVFPAAAEAMRRLRAAGKTVLILSNSGKRAAANAGRLEALGLAATLYDGIVTSGEAAWRGLAERAAPPFAGLGRRCFAVTRGSDRSILDGLDLDPAENPATADFILLAGLDDAAADLAPWRARLAPAAARGVPMLCANPDLTMFGQDPAGRPALLAGPGAIAALYVESGGPVHHVGKPHAPIYAHCLAVLGNPSPSRVLAVGDSLEHDILGGNRAGMPTALVAEGVHAAALRPAETQAELAAAIRRLAPAAGARPCWALRKLAW